MKRFQIPPAVAAAIRHQWPNEMVLKPEARQWGWLRRLLTPGALVPRTLPSEPELDFWNITDDQQMADFLFDGLLPALTEHGGKGVPLKGLPAGYLPLREALEFEQHCQWEGLSGALGNFSPAQVRKVVGAYRALEMDSEADAIAAAMLVAKSTKVDDDEFDKRVTAAYALTIGSNDDREVDYLRRLVVMGQFIRSHPEQFGVEVR